MRQDIQNLDFDADLISAMASHGEAGNGIVIGMVAASDAAILGFARCGFIRVV